MIYKIICHGTSTQFVALDLSIYCQIGELFGKIIFKNNFYNLNSNRYDEFVPNGVGFCIWLLNVYKNNNEIKEEMGVEKGWVTDMNLTGRLCRSWPSSNRFVLVCRVRLMSTRTTLIPPAQNLYRRCLSEFLQTRLTNCIYLIRLVVGVQLLPPSTWLVFFYIHHFLWVYKLDLLILFTN